MLDVLHQLMEAFPFVVPEYTLSCTSPNARSMGFARKQYVGNHNNSKRGARATHCSTAFAL